MSGAGTMPRTIDRPRLNERFKAGLHRRLTLVEAPLGYGKTTLMQSWCTYLSAEGYQVESISLDGLKADSATLVYRAVAKLADFETAGEANGQSGAGDHSEPYDSQILAATLTAVRKNSFLVLDDFHEASDTCARLVQSLLRQAPQCLRLIIGSREPAGIPLTKLRMADQVTDFSLSDLKFSAEEAAELFEGELPAEILSAYVDRAEGWIAALQLLRQAKGPDTSGFHGAADDFDQLSAFADYLNEQYFTQLEDTARDLLLHTAHVSPINGDLADRLTGRKDSWSILVKLAQSHALIFEDSRTAGGSFRFHQLLRDFLQRKQLQLGSARVCELHEIAGEWFLDHGDLRSAIRHACEAGAPQRAVDMLLSKGCVQYGFLEGAARLSPCLNQIPSNLIYSNPRLLVARAYLFLKSGRIRDAAELLTDLRRDSDQQDKVLDWELMLVEAHLRIYEDTPISRRQLDAVEHTIASIPSTDPLMRGLMSNFLCMFLIEQGEFAKAKQVGEAAMAFYRDIGAEHLQFFMHVHLSVIDLEQGRFDRAYERRRKAIAICQNQFSFDPSLRAIADVYHSEIAYECGDIHGLTPRLLQALSLIDKNEGWNMLYLSGYETCLMLTFQNAGYGESVELLENAWNMVARRGSVLFSNQLRSLELDLATRAGQETQARKLAEDVDRLRTASGSRRPLRWRGIIRAELALARYEARFRDPMSARSRLESASAVCGEFGLVRLHLRVLVRQAILEVQLGCAERAEQFLKTFLAKGMDLPAIGAAMSEGEAFSHAANAIISQRGLGSFEEAEIKHLAQCLWRISGHDNGDQASILTELLTPKEFDVLKQLAVGQANKVIARELDISEPTVKFHLQNIYRKIGVNSRKVAMEIARQHGVSSMQDARA
ncbi:LuxR C-terminal-related transcriptional regulator [Hoeflea sp.]|uniref:LuxR C-terminal-related transcriptional regulator n=1 Tax=Hoeflea sp. TaxID=1940281 RepID=UPI003B026003